MPILKNAKKALRASERKAVINRRVRSRLRTMIQKMRATPTGENLATSFSAIDRAVKGNLIHRNTAARLKSQLSKRAA